MAVVIALDAGTTGVRAVAVSEQGRPLDFAYREFTQLFPKPGWVEHDPNEIWEAIRAVATELIERLTQPIAAIGITNQRETVVAWSRRTGQSLTNAIVWQDRRGAERCDQLSEAGFGATIRSTTGLVVDPYFSATKIEWLIKTGGIKPTDDICFGTIDSWLVWNLTGGAEFVTEASNASRTMLFDINSLDWSDELCDLFGVPRGCLPELRPSSGKFGETSASCGLPAGIAISGLAGDQQAALFGQACFEPGMTKNTYGTGSFVLMNVGNKPPRPAEGLLSTVAWTIGDETTYALEGAIFSTGSTVQWLRDGLGIIENASATDALADRVDSTDGVYIVPAFTGLGSPWWDPYARGTIVGITRGTNRSHLARAALESMAFQTRDVIAAMSTAGHSLRELRVDGGASESRLMLQTQADQLRVPVLRASEPETTALGAAYLAGLATEVWTQSDISALWSGDPAVVAQADEATAHTAHGQWLRALERSRNWA